VYQIKPSCALQARKMSTTPAFSSHYDPEKAVKDIAPLLKENGGKWVLTQSGKGVERSFKFKTFKKTWVGLSSVIFDV
jgi:hypothetical protein